MRWTPETLAAAAGGRLRQSGARAIATAFFDSRQPRRDALFVPIVAARDGHDFIAAAARAGASACLIAAGRAIPPGCEGLTVVEVDDTLAGLTALARAARSRIEGPVVAITGSNGKTTTRAFVEAALATGFDPVLCTPGNFNNHIGLPLTLVDEPHDPAAAVLELGMSAPGENDQLARVAGPTIHVITSVALEHLEFMGSLEAIAAAEAEPIAHLQAGSDGRAPALIVPSDEPSLVPHLPDPRRGIRVLRVGPEQGGEALDVAITEVEVGVRTRVVLRLRSGERLELWLATFGAHNARNAASAVATAMHLELPLRPLVEALEAVDPVGDRGRLRELGPHLLIADCYNANPGSMHAALTSLAMLREARPGRLIAVLGDMLELGPTQAELHREIGARAAELGLDAVLGFGPCAAAIVEGARAGGVAALHLDNDEAAVEQAAAWVREQLGDRPGAALFKASRGIRLERIVARLSAD
ncbi:MAG: UDP-N-acetylmuramoyl-tripeptide--D-alanyl-D-alanine ligase [Enhygromyxa sp.]